MRFKDTPNPRYGCCTSFSECCKYDTNRDYLHGHRWGKESSKVPYVGLENYHIYYGNGFTVVVFVCDIVKLFAIIG